MTLARVLFCLRTISLDREAMTMQRLVQAFVAKMKRTSESSVNYCLIQSRTRQLWQSQLFQSKLDKVNIELEI